jgi:hypothetical protein
MAIQSIQIGVGESLLAFVFQDTLPHQGPNRP